MTAWKRGGHVSVPSVPLLHSHRHELTIDVTLCFSRALGGPLSPVISAELLELV